MWTRGIILAAVASLAACDANEPQLQQVPQAVALADSGADGSITVAFASSESTNRLPDVLSSDSVRDFHWVRITILPAQAAQVKTEAGLQADLAQATSGVIFTQVYEGICNPATGNNSNCWLFERYTSGDSGLKGTLALRMTDTLAVGSYDVTWEGVTDRFGPPTQRYKHGTIGGYSAEILGGLK